MYITVQICEFRLDSFGGLDLPNINSQLSQLADGARLVFIWTGEVQGIDRHGSPRAQKSVPTWAFVAALGQH